MSALLRLYPRPWRDRYEAELLEVLAARPPSVRAAVDLVRGAVDAHLHPELVHGTSGRSAAVSSSNAGHGRIGIPGVSELFFAILAACLFMIAAISAVFRAPVFMGSFDLLNAQLAFGSAALAAAIWRSSSQSLISRIGALILAAALVALVPSDVILAAVLPLTAGSVLIAIGSVIDRRPSVRRGLLLGICGLALFAAYRVLATVWFPVVAIAYAAAALGLAGGLPRRAFRLAGPLLAAILVATSGYLLVAGTNPTLAHDGYQLICDGFAKDPCLAQADAATAHHRALQPNPAIVFVQVGPEDQRQLCWGMADDSTCELGGGDWR